MTTRQERVSDVIAKLEELIVQATTEHSHYYVASVCKEALKELQQLRAALPEVRAALEKISTEHIVDAGSFKLHIDKVVLHRHLAHEALALLDSLEAGE